MHKKFDTLLSPWYDLENIEALSNYAIRKNAFGILATTWHTLPDKIQAITYTAQCCWNGAGDMNSQNIRLAICGRLARKAIQAENYAESGFRNEDVSV